MAASSGGSGRQTLTEINVTPLVDVMLVLLIIFMVTAPLIQQGVEVSLPEARAKAVEAEDQKLVLSIKSDHSLYLGSSEDAARIPFESLEDKLRANARAMKDRELYLMADKTLPYGFVVDVMATVQRAGITNVGMITNPAADKVREARQEGRR
ncbi:MULTISPECIES: protein TolR [Anaeromyxobacter]|uniref:protein TolR n=1 Tax=Anaeromyxobacter TaxID=161492 RepID=UPI001F57B431|nr:MULTISPECIES: protein TolR [unclassified Anaeromyxobacter]